MITAASTATQPAATASPAAAAKATLSGDLETFLRLLTTQMRNQDPLKPMESSDFAVQLATFSGVEQQVRTNKLLEELGGGLGMGGIGQLAGWIGMEARVAAPVRYSGLPVSLAPEPAPGADRTILVVSDATGAEVLRETIPVSSQPYVWSGGTSAGGGLPPGTYSFMLESYGGDRMLGRDAVAAYARVTEVRTGPDGGVVVLEGGAEVPAADVRALREPLI
jgi:flagellar basal-body rod modification protein FlgD